jgi:hypothetical protein
VRLTDELANNVGLRKSEVLAEFAKHIEFRVRHPHVQHSFPFNHDALPCKAYRGTPVKRPRATFGGMANIAQKTMLFDRDNEEEVGSIDGVHPFPVGTVVIAQSGSFLVEQVRLMLTGEAKLWLDVRKAKMVGRGFVPEE